MKQQLIFLLLTFISCDVQPIVDMQVKLKSECITSVPTIQTSKLEILSFTESSVTIKVKRGNGDYYLLERIPFPDFNLSNLPQNETTYTLNELIGQHGGHVAYIGTDSVVTLYGCNEPCPGYWLFKGFEVNGSEGCEKYNTTTNLNVEVYDMSRNGYNATIFWYPTSGTNDTIKFTVKLNNEIVKVIGLRHDEQVVFPFSIKQPQVGDTISLWYYSTKNKIDSDVSFYPPVIIE